MKTQPLAIIGIDISKAILDVCRLFHSCQVDNNSKGFNDLSPWITRQNYMVDLFVFEATDRYHKPLEHWLFSNQRVWVKLNPHVLDTLPMLLELVLRLTKLTYEC